MSIKTLSDFEIKYSEYKNIQPDTEYKGIGVSVDCEYPEPQRKVSVDVLDCVSPQI